MWRTSAISLTALASFFSPAHADEVVKRVSMLDVVETFGSFGLRDIEDGTADPRYPTVRAIRPDGFTVNASFFGCEPTGCVGLSLITPIPARTIGNARIIEGSIERSAVGFDAWVQENNSVVVIETYLAFDGGVSNTLLPSTLHALLQTVDQTKGFMLSDDPRVREVWPKVSAN